MEKIKLIQTEKNDFFVGWICGFIDGEGCFSVSFNYKTHMACGIETRPSFSVSQKHHSLKSLEIIKDYFKCGGIRHSNKDGTYKYEVRNIKDLTTIIIPFFRKNKLYTKKSEDFLVFDEVCTLIIAGGHLNKNGLANILKKSFKINGSGKRKHSLEILLKFIS